MSDYDPFLDLNKQVVEVAVTTGCFIAHSNATIEFLQFGHNLRPGTFQLELFELATVRIKKHIDVCRKWTSKPTKYILSLLGVRATESITSLSYLRRIPS